MSSLAGEESVATTLAEVERHLERTLASGWRGAEGEVAELTRFAGELAEAGLTDFAERLGALGQAADASEALRRIALCHAACRMLQARLISPPPAPTGLQPIPATKEAGSPRLLVVAPLVVAGRPVWACARLERGVAVELVLVEAPPAEPPPETAVPTARPSIARRMLGRLTGGADASRAPTGPWLHAELRSELAWQETLPLAASAVHLHALGAGEPLHLPREKEDIAAQAREGIHTSNVVDGEILVRAGGALRLRKVERVLMPGYVWLDAGIPATFERAVSDEGWAIAWMVGQALAPLAIVRPGGILRQAQLLPLIPGAEPLSLAE
jgi:hypothetical protein